MNEAAKRPRRRFLRVCSICHHTFREFSNNAWPVNEGRCCDHCDSLVVIPARLREMGYPDDQATAVGQAEFRCRIMLRHLREKLAKKEGDHPEKGG